MDRDMRIRQRAYEIWEREGRPEGRAEAHWARAEQEVGDQEQILRNGFGCSDDPKVEAEGLLSRAAGNITDLASHVISTGLSTIRKIAEPAMSPPRGRRKVTIAAAPAAADVTPPDGKAAAAPAGKVRPLSRDRGKAAGAGGPGGTVRIDRNGTSRETTKTSKEEHRKPPRIKLVAGGYLVGQPCGWKSGGSGDHDSRCRKDWAQPSRCR
jgi:hypothetical protein